MRWVLNQSDCHSLLVISEPSELPFELLSEVALGLHDADLLAERVEVTRDGRRARDVRGHRRDVRNRARPGGLARFPRRHHLGAGS